MRSHMVVRIYTDRLEVNLDYDVPVRGGPPEWTELTQSEADASAERLLVDTPYILDLGGPSRVYRFQAPPALQTHPRHSAK